MMDNPQARFTRHLPRSLSRFALAILLTQISLVHLAVAQSQVWQPCSQLLIGKTIRSLHLCPTGTILAGSSNGDIFRSTDDGESWTRVRKGWAPVELMNPEANQVRVFAEKKDGTVVAGTDRGELVTSTDDGRTWQPISTAPYVPDIRDILISEKGEMFLATYRDGVLRALPEGNGWGYFEQVFDRRFLLSLAARPGDIIVGTFQQGAYRSTDDGNSWGAMRSGFKEGGSLPSISSMVLDSTGEMVAVTEVSMYFLKRGDTTWTRYVKSDLYLSSLAKKGSRIVGIAYAPGVFPTFAESIGDIHTWRRIAQQILPEKFYKRAVIYTAKNQILVGGDVYGIYRTSDAGRTWDQMIKGLTNTYVISLASDQKANILYAGTLHTGLFRSTDEGATWTNIGLRVTPILGVAAKGPYIYAVNGVYLETMKRKPDLVRSDDGGRTWSRLSPSLESHSPVKIAFGRKSEVFLATRGQGIFFSPNNAERWESRNDGLADTVVYDVTSMENGYTYAATQSGIFESGNNGKKWLLSGLKDIKCISLAFNSKKQLYVGTDSLGLYSLNTYQKVWKQIRSPLEKVTLLNIDAKGIIVAGNERQGLYRSSDGGKRWLPYSGGLPQILNSASLVSTKKALFLASVGDGIYKTGGVIQQQAGIGGAPDTATRGQHTSSTTMMGTEIEAFARQGHSDQIRSIAFSPDGKLLASASADKTVRLWDVAKGKQLRSFVPVDFECFTAAFSPDGKTLWAGGYQNLWVWDIAKGTLLRRISGELGLYKVLKFSQDGSILATAQGSGMIQLFNPKTFAAVKTLQRTSVRDAEVTNLWFLDSAKTLMSIDLGGRLRYRNLAGSVDTIWHSSTPFPVRSAYVTSDGRRFAAASLEEDHINILNCDSRKFVTTIDRDPRKVLWVAFAADGDLIFTAERNDTLEIWSRSSGELLQAVNLGGWGETLASSSTGIDLATASGKELRFWSLHWPNLDSGQVLIERFRVPGAAKVQSLSYRSTDRTITFARSDDKISTLRMTSRPVLNTWKADMPLIQSAAVSPTQPVLAVLARDFSVALWNTRTGSKVRTLMGSGAGYIPNSSPHSIAISPNGVFLASVQSGPNTKLWDMRTGASLATLIGKWHRTQALAFSPDSKFLAVGGSEGLVTIWNTKDKTETHPIRRPSSTVHALSFDPAGANLATAYSSGWTEIIDISDTENGKSIRTLALDVPRVQCLSIAKVNNTDILASGHQDGSLRLWDYLNGTKATHLGRHAYAVSGLAFASKGAVLISSSEDGTVKLWDTASGNELASINFFGDRDWAATTPDGHFDGTREGMKRVVLFEHGDTLMNERSKIRHRQAGLLTKLLESKPPR